MTKSQVDHCPICAKRAVLHTDALVRALGVRLLWDEAELPLAVCEPCYGVLATYRQVAFESRLKEETR